MNQQKYIDLNIKLLKKYLENPYFPGRETGIEVCLYKIKEAEATGVFDKKDVRPILAELKEFRILERIKRNLKKYLENPNFPGRETGIEVCLYKIKQAEAAGVFDKKVRILARIKRNFSPAKELDVV
jgi:uncharacterized protein YqgQ